MVIALAPTYSNIVSRSMRSHCTCTSTTTVAAARTCAGILAAFLNNKRYHYPYPTQTLTLTYTSDVFRSVRFHRTSMSMTAVAEAQLMTLSTKPTAVLVWSTSGDSMVTFTSSSCLARRQR